MSARAWLLRDAVRRIVADAPLPPATWLSVARRSLIVVGCFVAGIILGDVQAGVLAAFGALQVALVETALPLRSLGRLLLLLGLACVGAVFIALVIGNSWWAVLALTLLAYVFGATGGLSAGAMTIGISSLALGVIFAGMPASSLDQAVRGAALVAGGIAAQSLAWLLVWHPERDRFVRNALANKLRTDIAILRASVIDIPNLVKTHTQVDIAEAAIATAQFRPAAEQRYRAVLSSTVVLTRALIAWIVLDEPSEAARIDVGLRVEQQIRRLDAVIPRRRRKAASQGGGASGPVEAALGQLDAAVTAALSRIDNAPVADDLVASARAHAGPARVGAADVLKALWPHGISRHGLRMAIGIGVAEALSMTIPITHSFWLPLTVAFTLRPDWTFTVIRGFTRTIGNLAAVIALPAIVIALNHDLAGITVALAVLTTITFRTFFGNYAIASFGLAGTVLLLDSTVAMGAELFLVRIVAAVLGALISMAVAFALPSWSSASAPDQVQQLSAVLARWRAAFPGTRPAAGPIDTEYLDACNADARRALIQLDQTSTGSLLEPRGGRRAIDLALVTAAGMREVASLIAVSTALSAPSLTVDEDAAQILTRARLSETARAYGDAVAAFERP